MLKKNNKFYLFLLFTFLLTTTVSADELLEKFGIGKVVFAKQALTLDVEIASTQVQKSIGLMFRENIPYKTGMLFVYQNQTIKKVWMKNTLVPLDVIFISSQGEIVSILEAVQPCKSEVCEIFDSGVPAQYMLEVNAGLVKKEAIQLGQRLLFFM